MNKLMVGLVLLGCLMGCKGPEGSKGDPGQSGLPGKPGNGGFVFLSGAVTSDDFIVYDSRINQADQIGVYMGDGTSMTQLPVFLPTLGVNCTYLFRNGQIEIYNAKKAGSVSYVVEIIIS